MKVHQFGRGLWEHEPSLTLGCKRLRPLAPNLSNTHTTTTTLTTFHLNTFITPQTPSTKLGSSHYNNNNKRDPSSPQSQVQVERHIQGGTRWNPTEEQIGILEMVYRGGMRTPNAQQIQEMTAQLSKYGKIEGKNVFYWFQNHKARERQKQKRNNLGLSHTPPTSTTFHTTKRGESVEIEEEDSPLKKCRSWAFEYMEEQSWSTWKEEEEHRTLELFPLHPEGR